MRAWKFVFSAFSSTVMAVLEDASEARLIGSVSADSQASSNANTVTSRDVSVADYTPSLYPVPNKRKREKRDEAVVVPIETGGFRTQGTFHESQPNREVFPDLYPAVIKQSIGTSKPIETSQSPQRLHGRVMEEFYLIALRLVDWIIPIFLLSSSALIVAFMYRYRYNNGLLFGTGITGGIYALVKSNSSTPTPLLVVMLLAYLLFHVSYCRTITLALRLGEGFAATASAVAMVLHAGLSQIPGLLGVWTESTGLAGMWSFLPVHLVVFFGSAVVVKMVRLYMRDERDLIPLLPVSTRHINDAVSTSRLDAVPESRR